MIVDGVEFIPVSQYAWDLLNKQSTFPQRDPAKWIRRNIFSAHPDNPHRGSGAAHSPANVTPRTAR